MDHRVFAVAAVAAFAFAPPPAGAQRYPAVEHGGNYMRNYYLPPAPAATPWYPAWRPDGERVAISMAGSIWSVDPASGVATELTYGPGEYHSSPEWSPDGRWLVYTSDDGARTIDLRVLDTETGEVRRLTDDEHLYLDPAFSPAGDRLAYVSTRPNGHYNVFVRPIRDGRWAGEPVPVTADHRYPRDRLYFGPWDMHITPAWMPSGDELLIVSNRDVALGSGNVFRVPVQENTMAEAVPVLEEQTLYRTRPDVSVDGKRFVYSSTSGAADQYSNLYVQPTDGGFPYKLTFFEHDAFHPRWSPDGERIAYVDNREGVPGLALLETYGGGNRVVEITERRWKREMGRLTVTVRDGETGALAEARIHLTASDGKLYAPSDAYARIGGRSGDRVFHTGGRFTVELPPGPARLVAVRGFEFRPDSTVVEIRAGEESRITLTPGRLADLASDGWYGGSTHVHMNYAGNLHNTLENLLFMSAAEDQEVVIELVANKDNRILDHQFFQPGGGPHPEATGERVLVVGEEYRPPFYGHVYMIGLRDHLISPFVTGYEATGIESLYPSNTDMMKKAKAQGAFTGYVHPFAGDDDPLGRDLGRAKGFLMDVALGTTDGLEWSFPERAGFFPLYAAWSMGFPVVATGGEDSISNLHETPLVGSHRTYVRTTDGRLTWDRWIEGLRRGRAFVTNGPLLETTLTSPDASGASRERGPGETLALAAGGGEIELVARVRSIVPLDSLLVVRDGEVVDRVPVSLTEDGAFEVSRRYAVARSGWFHVRAFGGSDDRFPLDTEWPQAFTNPIWVTVGGAPVRSAAAARYGIEWIRRLRELAAEWPWWRSEAERTHVFGQLDEARGVFEARLREAGR